MERTCSKETLSQADYNPNLKLEPLALGLHIKQAGKSEIDLSTYYGVSEIYREPLSSTSISLATSPENNERVAIKKIYKSDLITTFQKSQAKQEFPLHCSLDHSNIVKGYEWSENENEYVMVMEFMNKATYFAEKIETNLTPIKNEIKIQSYMVDALEGLLFLHNKGIAHGDIKLENMLVSKNEEDKIPIVKLCDFGLARFQDEKTKKFHMETAVGSHSYMAPEIKANSYVDCKIDMWALGVVLYKMSVAYKPTQIAGYKYGKGPIPFRKFDWKKRSPELQDFITQLLEEDPAKRISAEDALQHPWFHVQI